MKIDQATADRIKHLRLMAFGSWLLVVFFGCLSLLARHYSYPLLGDLLLGATVLLGLLFAFHVFALMATAVSLIYKRASSGNDA
jgi:uncharacterized membrane protein (DUF485 family)